MPNCNRHRHKNRLVYGNFGGGKTVKADKSHGVVSKNVGDCAFRNCSALTSATIGSGVTTMGEQVFAGCDALTAISVKAASKPEGWDEHWSSYGIKDNYAEGEDPYEACKAEITWNAD